MDTEGALPPSMEVEQQATREELKALWGAKKQAPITSYLSSTGAPTAPLTRTRETNWPTIQEQVASCESSPEIPNTSVAGRSPCKGAMEGPSKEILGY